MLEPSNCGSRDSTGSPVLGRERSPQQWHCSASTSSLNRQSQPHQAHRCRTGARKPAGAVQSGPAGITCLIASFSQAVNFLGTREEMTLTWGWLVLRLFAPERRTACNGDSRSPPLHPHPPTPRTKRPTRPKKHLMPSHLKRSQTLLHPNTMSSMPGCFLLPAWLLSTLSPFPFPTSSLSRCPPGPSVPPIPTKPSWPSLARVQSLGEASPSSPAANGGCMRAALPVRDRARQRAVSPRFLLSTWLLRRSGSCQEQRGEGNGEGGVVGGGRA